MELAPGLSDRQLHAPMSFVGTTTGISLCADSGEQGSEKWVFLQAR